MFSIKRCLYFLLCLWISQSTGLLAEGIDLSSSDPTTESFKLPAVNAFPAIVKIDVIRSNPIDNTNGSGFFATSSGTIVVNAHLVQNAEQILVYFQDQQITAVIANINVDEDIAILTVPGTNFPYLTFADSDHVRLYEWTVFVGNPFSMQPYVAKAIIGGLDNQGRFLYTDNLIESVSSDGILLTLDGNVAGVSSSLLQKERNQKNVGVAIPSNTVKKMITTLVE